MLSLDGLIGRRLRASPPQVYNLGRQVIPGRYLRLLARREQSARQPQAGANSPAIPLTSLGTGARWRPVPVLQESVPRVPSSQMRRRLVAF